LVAPTGKKPDAGNKSAISEGVAEMRCWDGSSIQSREYCLRKAETMRARRGLVVAETGADGDLVAALGTAPAKYGCARLGLHPGKKPVGLRAVAAVGLEGTLRHLTRLLLNLFFAICNSLSVYLKGFAIQNLAEGSEVSSATESSYNQALQSRIRSARNCLAQ
jgi:hypothetical protein